MARAVGLWLNSIWEAWGEFGLLGWGLMGGLGRGNVQGERGGELEAAGGAFVAEDRVLSDSMGGSGEGGVMEAMGSPLAEPP